MSAATIRTETLGRQRRLTFDAGDKPNPIGERTLDELDAALDAVEADADVSVVSVAGAGGRFATGAALDELAEWWAAERWDRVFAFVERGGRVVDRIDRLPVPTIAAIDGYALGGGLEVALACDFRIASSGAQLGTPEVDLGMLPAWGGTHRLPALLGEARALDLVLTGRRLEAEEAASLGLVNRVVAAEDLLATVDDLADALAAKPPATVAAILEAVRAARSGSAAEAAAVAVRNDMRSIFTAEARERTRAFFDRD